AVVNAYLIRSLPFPSADRLYHVIYAPPGQPEPRGMTAIDWKSLDPFIEVPVGSSLNRFYLADGDYTQEAIGIAIPSGTLDVLGVRGVKGRSFVQEDFAPDSEAVALIGHALWQERFGSDPQVAGRVFRASLNDQATTAQPFRIIGVLPPDFRYAAD